MEKHWNADMAARISGVANAYPAALVGAPLSEPSRLVSAIGRVGEIQQAVATLIEQARRLADTLGGAEPPEPMPGQSPAKSYGLVDDLHNALTDLSASVHIAGQMVNRIATRI